MALLRRSRGREIIRGVVTYSTRSTSITTLVHAHPIVGDCGSFLKINYLRQIKALALMQAHTTRTKGSGRDPQLGIEGSSRKQSERLRPTSSSLRRHDRPHARAYVTRAVLLYILRVSLLLVCLPLLSLLLDLVILVAIKPRPSECLTHCHGAAVHHGSGASRLGLGIG